MPPTDPAPRVLLLDRDGVINENRNHYVRSWESFSFLPGALQALADLTRGGYRLVVLTNQSMVGRGLVSWATVQDIHDRMCQAVGQAGGAICDILVCPHAPEAGCACRKPLPGLVLEARRRHGVPPGAAYFVGDHRDDVAAALAGGCRPVLLATGRGSSVRAEVEEQWGDAVLYLPDLPAVAHHLLAAGPTGTPPTLHAAFNR